MSYLGRSAKLSLKAQEKVSFLATAGQTSKTGLSYTPSFIEVYVNGVLLTDTTDFTATNGNSVTFTVALLLNDEVTVISLKTFTVADHYSKTQADTLLATKATVANFTSTGIDDNATSTAVTIDASENVGIGESAPAQRLEVNELSQTAFTGIRVNNPNGNVGSAGIEFQVDGNYSKAAIFQKRGHANGGGDLIFAVDSSTDAANWVEGDEKLRITKAGNVTVNNGNLVIGTNGKGIDFSANADSSATGASTTSELLDDYEEGTWTPVVQAAAGNPSSINFSTAPSGRYTKIGRQVTISFYLHINVATGGSGNFQLHGVPFTCASGNGGFSGAVSLYYGDASLSDPVLKIDTSYLSIICASGAGGYFSNVTWASAQLSAFANNTAMAGTVTYFV